MRYLFLLILFISLNSYAQDALKVTYGKQFSYTLKDLPSESSGIKEAMRKAMQEINYHELILLNNEANYFPIQKIRNDQPVEKGTIMVSFGDSSQKIYLNYDDQIKLRYNTMYGQENIIKSQLPMKEWEITRETKEILGMTVRKATFESDEKEEIAWYASTLAYKSGPEDIWGLPGLILEYKSTTKTDEKTIIHIFATHIESLPNEKVKFFIPDESKSVSEEEYHEMVEMHNKKFRELYNQGVDTSD